VLGRMTNSRRLIGEDAPREWAARWVFTERVETQGAHMIEQDIELASAVAGDDLKPMAPLLPVNPAAESWADAVMAGAGSGKSNRPSWLTLVRVGRQALAGGAICGGCARAGPSRHARVVNVGPGEEDLAEPISGATGGAATPVSCSVEQLIALTRRIQLAIAGDTGHCTWPVRWPARRWHYGPPTQPQWPFRLSVPRTAQPRKPPQPRSTRRTGSRADDHSTGRCAACRRRFAGEGACQVNQSQIQRPGRIGSLTGSALPGGFAYRWGL